MEDGVAGLAAVRWVGGTALVQDPTEAAYPQLPQNAIKSIEIDRVQTLEDLAASIVELSKTRAAHKPIPPEVKLHAELDRASKVSTSALDELGDRSTTICPECGGPLWNLKLGATAMYRCFLGHAISPKAILDSRETGPEETLWRVVRMLEDRAEVHTTIARSLRQRRDEAAAAGEDAHAAEVLRHARRIMDIIVDLQQMP
jgi:two-component system chemotaxis response regulator CheB